MVLVPISALSGYMMTSKQTQQGVSVTPTNAIRFLTGSTIDWNVTAEDLAEGDGSRRLSWIIKNKQMVTIKTVVHARPVIAGLLEDAAMGAGSDTFTNATISTTLTSTPTIAVGGTANTTLNGGISAGATTFVVTASTGLTGTGLLPILLDGGTMIAEVVVIQQAASGTTCTIANSGTTRFAHLTGATVQTTQAINLTANTGLTGTALQQLCVSAGAATEEVATVQTPSISVSTPYTYYVTSNNGTLVNSGHLSADAVKSKATHVSTDQAVGSYFTWEVSLGGTSGLIARVTDCQVDEIKRSSKAGSTLDYEITWKGLATSVQAAALTPSFEAHNPYLYVQSNGGWTIDSSTTGEALNIEEFTIDQKNALEEVQTEALVPSALLFTTIRTDLSWKVPFVDKTRAAKTLFGGINGTTDSQTLWAGNITILFTQPDNFNTLQYNLPNIMNPKWGGVQLNTDGKHFDQEVSASGTSGQGSAAYLIQTTSTNSKYAQY